MPSQTTCIACISDHVTKMAVNHSIRHVRLFANFKDLFSIEPELLIIEVTHCGNGNFLAFVAVTLTLTRWPSYTNLIRIWWRGAGWPKMNFVRQSFQKLSYIHR